MRWIKLPAMRGGKVYGHRAGVNAHQVSGVWQHSPLPPTTTNLLAGKGSLQGGVGVSATDGVDEMMVPILNMSINEGEGQVGLWHLANIQNAPLQYSCLENPTDVGAW